MADGLTRCLTGQPQAGPGPAELLALDRWNAQLGPLPLEWSEMREAQRDAYEDFLTIAGCQLTVASLNVGAFMSLRDENLTEHIESVQQDLGHAKKTVEALV